MHKMTRRGLGSAGFALLLAATASFAQQPQTVRVNGTIEKVDGPTLVIKSRQGDEVKVDVTDNVAVFGVVKATLAEIKPGAYIGVGATPQTDGSQRAIQVIVFADIQRGLGEGHRPWNRPNSTMTNATVDSTVAGVDGVVVMVKYKDGEKKIVIPPDAIILGYVVGDKSELKPGANIAIINATKKPDGTLETARVNVGRGGVVPPM
jgi:hypothetical protein